MFSFILSGKISLKAETLLEHYADLSLRTIPNHVPNLLVSLADGHISWLQSSSNSLCRSAMKADQLAFSPDSAGGGFPMLIFLLRLYSEAGRTVSTRHYRRYFERPDSEGHPIQSIRSVAWDTDPHPKTPATTIL